MGAVGTVQAVGAQGRASMSLLRAGPWGPGTQPSNGARPLETVGEMRPSHPRRAEVRASSPTLL